MPMTSAYLCIHGMVPNVQQGPGINVVQSTIDIVQLTHVPLKKITPNQVYFSLDSLRLFWRISASRHNWQFKFCPTRSHWSLSETIISQKYQPTKMPEIWWWFGGDGGRRRRRRRKRRRERVQENWPSALGCKQLSQRVGTVSICLCIYVSVNTLSSS